MSRCTVKIADSQDRYMVVGLDRPLKSWFGQLWLDDDVVGDIDTRSNGEMLVWMNENGIDKSDPYSKAVYMWIGMDLDPGELSPETCECYADYAG